MALCAAVQGLPRGTQLLVHPEDDMARGDVAGGRPGERLARYLRSGYEAYQVLVGLLGACRLPAPRLLDYACGYGRVLRHLAAGGRFSEIAAGDLLEDATQFVVREFGATAVHCHREAGRVQIPGRFDAIWVGSLFSHLDGAHTLEFLGLLERHLEPGGVLVLSNHSWSLRPGAELAELAGGAEQAEGVGASNEGGHGLRFLSGSESRRLDPDYYGTTYSSPEAMRLAAGRVGLELCCFGERVLWNVQDAYAFVRAEEAASFQLSEHPETLSVPRGEVLLQERTPGGQVRLGGFVRFPPHWKEPLEVRVHLEDGSRYPAQTREVFEFQPSDGLRPGWRQLDFLLEGPLPSGVSGPLPVAISLSTRERGLWCFGAALL